jgi:hypothetical protein
MSELRSENAVSADYAGADGYTVTFHGLPANADAAARSMLRLLLPMLGNRWRIGQTIHSDVVILEPEELAKLRSKEAAQDDTLYVLLSRDTALPFGAFTTIPRPLNSARLVEMLHLAQEELDRRMLRPDNTVLAQVDEGADAVDLDARCEQTTMRDALGSVLQHRSWPVLLRDSQREPILWLLPDLGFATHLRSNHLADLIRTNAPVDLIRLEAHEALRLHGRHKFAPVSKLEWIHWLAGSDGQIRPGLTVSHPYRLRKYPDFAVLPHYRGDVRMASLLKAEPMTVGELAQRAGVRLETACHFVNACWALGLLGDPAAARATSSAVDAGARSETKQTDALLAA